MLILIEGLGVGVSLIIALLPSLKDTTSFFIVPIVLTPNVLNAKILSFTYKYM